MVKNILKKGGVFLAAIGLSACTSFNNIGVCQNYIYDAPQKKQKISYIAGKQKDYFNYRNQNKNYGYSKNILSIYFENPLYFYDFDTDGDGILDKNDPWPYNYGPVVDRNFNGYIDSRDLHINYPNSNWSFRYNYCSYPRFSYRGYYGGYYLRYRYWNIDKGMHYYHYFHYDFDDNYKERIYYGQRRDMQKEERKDRIRHSRESYESRSSRRRDYDNKNYETPSRREINDSYYPRRKRNSNYNSSPSYNESRNSSRKNNYSPSYDRNNSRRSYQKFNSGNSRRNQSSPSYQRNNKSNSSSGTRRSSSKNSNNKSSSGRRR